MTRLRSTLVLSLVACFSAGCIPEADEGVLGGTGGGAVASGGTPGSGGIGAGTGGATGTTGGRTGTGGSIAATGGRTGTGGAIAATGGRTGTGGGGIPTCQMDMGGATGSTGATDPLNTAAKCSSGRTWMSGNGATMMPGDRCQGCHLWTVAGTIYPTGHEPTYCNGLSDSSVSIVITDSQCRVVTLTPNGAGNFYSQATLVGDLAVKVIRGQNVRRMVTRAPHGECNACHTPMGIQGAPGRIVPPP